MKKIFILALLSIVFNSCLGADNNVYDKVKAYSPEDTKRQQIVELINKFPNNRTIVYRDREQSTYSMTTYYLNFIINVFESYDYELVYCNSEKILIFKKNVNPINKEGKTAGVVEW